MALATKLGASEQLAVRTKAPSSIKHELDHFCTAEITVNAAYSYCCFDVLWAEITVECESPFPGVLAL